jgi:uncharacterized protein
MNRDLVLEQTEEFVKSKLEGEATGHDYYHTLRVKNLAIYIAKKEKADLFIVQLAALLHDIADWKFNKDDLGPKIAKDFLEKLNLDSKTVDHVCNIIKELSFKGAKVKSNINTVEGKVVQDADRLDAIGAIGIARAFAYGGHSKMQIYNPNIKPKLHETSEEYKNSLSQGTTINHFYEKLLLLKDLMNTSTARILAEERHNFLELFLKEFHDEWEGK